MASSFTSPTTTSTVPSSSTLPTFPIVKYISQEISLKLTAENFLLWKTQVLLVLRTHKLLGFIDGSFPKPDQPPEDIAKWEPLDQMVLGWMLGSLSPQVLSQVVDKSSAREAWCVFETFYGKLSRARIQQLKTDLQSIQKGSSAIHESVHQTKSLSLALASAGKPIDDDDLILWTLRGLGSEFDPIVAAINSRPNSPTFEEVCGLLLDFELRLNASSTTQPATAFVASSPHSSRHLLPTPPSTCVVQHRPWAAARTTDLDGEGTAVAAPMFVVVVVPPCHPPLLPTSSAIGVAIRITRLTLVGHPMKLLNLPRLSMQ